VAFAALLDAAVVIAHGPRKLLVVHLDTSIGLHQAPVDDVTKLFFFLFNDEGAK